MNISRSLARGLVCLVGLVAFTAATAKAADNGNQRGDKERAFIQVLASDAPGAEKALACKQLSIYGSDAAVPELAKLLSDEHLASWSRIALEAIPGATADEALRKALPTLQGKLLVGVVNSIGVRADAAAVESLSGLLANQDADVASAAAVALGPTRNAPATGALRQALAAAPPAVRSAVAEGCVLCAERALAEKQAPQAIEIYDQVRKADLPKQRIVEATRGAILARGNDGITLLVEQIRSPDREFFYLGLTTARQLPGEGVAKALTAELVGATPERAALLLKVLADRHDTIVLPSVLEAAASGAKQVRLAALEVLPRLGNDSCVEPLLQIATGSDPELAAAAKAAIAGLPGEKVDADITSRLGKAEGQSLPVLIELVGLRRIPANAALVKAAADPQSAVRSAAWTALGATVGLKELPVLITEVASPKHPEDAQVAQQALRAACIRMPEGEECADQLATAMSGAPIATQCTLLEILGAMGGAKSLATLAAAGKGNEPLLQDVATKSLGEWMNLDAAPVLLDLAKNAPGEKYQVRALRGYMRLARQFVKQDNPRVAMCQQAFDVAKRTAEQKLVLETVARSSTLPALRLAVKVSEVPELKPEATKVALTIAAKLGDKNPEVQKLVARVKAN